MRPDRKGQSPNEPLIIGFSREQFAPALQIEQGKIPIVMSCVAVELIGIRLLRFVLGDRKIHQNCANHARVQTGSLQRDLCPRAPAHEDELSGAPRRMQKIHRLLGFLNGALREGKAVMPDSAVSNPGKVKPKYEKASGG